MSLTPEAVAALAPDAASLKAGQKLATPTKWPTLALDEGVLWGEAQGSGQQPYLVGVDLRTADIASKCSCPSRKFPCKHALGLLLLHAQGASEWQTRPPPETLTKWLSGRTARTEKPKAAAKAADPTQQAKTWAKREKKMSAGLEALELWLSDLVREGLLAARQRSYSDWDGQAARLVDAQLPGAARLVRQIPGLLHEERGEALTAHLGRLYLLIQAWKNRESLGSGERADLLTALELPLDKSALTPSLQSKWLCVGSTTEEEGRLTVRRTWLLGEETGEVALLLDFASRAAAMNSGFLPLHRQSGALAYAPSAYHQRAVLETTEEAAVPTPLSARHAHSLGELTTLWAGALAANPWLERVGVLLGPVYLTAEQVCGYDGTAIPLAEGVGSSYLWYLWGQANTEPAYTFGEWDGQSFFPLSLSPESEAAR
ncbi:SWIM zinc finger family protein [Deinococcus sp. SL84]|uniref:SWIM zinc finger family protein n=1 Tax=Deinococcus sp. SL84 TaxID=2994663 RepID=UPI002274EDB2|nr:SWIM zinc finger family protein [Deinococcus sp. SL84]MCY1704310.1 SWIM zinc finger family protein [Deinococcus sp. SL84]